MEKLEQGGDQGEWAKQWDEAMRPFLKEVNDQMDKQYRDTMIPLHPEIYGKKMDDQEMAKAYAGYVERLEPEKLMHCVKGYNHSFIIGNRRLVRYLIGVLDLEYAPELDFKKVEKRPDYKAYYNLDTNVLRVPYTGDRVGRYEDINIIAHEMWHARQAQEVRNGGERAEQYRINRDCYIEEDEVKGHKYEDQLVEREANGFGRAVVRKVKEMLAENS